MRIKFDVNNQIITRTDSKKVVNLSEDYLQCEFKFRTNDWKDVEKYVIFKDVRDNFYKVELGTDMTVVCFVPNKVLLNDYFLLSLYGGTRITTNEKTIALIQSGYVDGLGESSEYHHKDVVSCIVDELNTKLDDIIYSDGRLCLYAHGELLDSIDVFTEDIIDKIQNELEFSDVASTGSWNDLIDVPLTFPPSEHNHVVNDITDFDDNIDDDFNNFLDALADEIVRE